jgi:hypothetical protein
MQQKHAAPEDISANVFELLTPTTEDYFSSSLSLKKDDSSESQKRSSFSSDLPLSPPQLPAPLPTASSFCNHDLCVTQSLRGNSYHSFRTAFLLQAILTAIPLPLRIQTLALEILHTLAVSSLQALSQQSEKLEVRFPQLTPCPLWSKDETSAVAVACICMACKVILLPHSYVHASSVSSAACALSSDRERRGGRPSKASNHRSLR